MVCGVPEFRRWNLRRAGDDQICRCKEMAEWFIHILILNISFGADERLIQIAFSADMYYLIGFQKLRKNAADSLIDRDGAETSADDQDYWAIGRKMGVLESRQTISVQKLFTDRGNRSEPPYLPEDI